MKLTKDNKKNGFFWLVALLLFVSIDFIYVLVLVAKIPIKLDEGSFLKKYSLHITFSFLILIYIIRIYSNKVFSISKNSNIKEFLILPDLLLLFASIYTWGIFIELLELDDIYIDFIVVITMFIHFIIFSISLVKNVLKTSYIKLMILSVTIFFAGWVSISNWKFISLLTVAINQMLTYDQIELIYKKFNGKDAVINIDEDMSKANIIWNKFLFNFSIVVLYFFLSATQNLNIISYIYKSFSKNRYIPYFMLTMFRGFERILIILIIFIIATIILKKAENREKYEDFKNDKINRFNKLFVKKQEKNVD